MSSVEKHPFKPFLPENAKLLMLGTFPPAQKRWSMEFYYPNFINDMWRIMGMCFYNDKSHFVLEQKKSFNLSLIIPFLKEKGIALYDTADEVVRTKNNASDKDLEIVKPSDFDGMLRSIPACKAVITAGQLATTIFCQHYNISEPKVGEYSDFIFDNRVIRLYRMPSSSRAYPMKLENKAIYYNKVFQDIL